jgi:glycosyltransferase involved in cell wall biosynthesis
MKIAIAMTVFDRPHYLSASLASLSQVEGIRDYPILFCIDGPYDDSSADRCKESLRLCNQFDHPDVTIMTREKNLGVANQVYDSKQVLFYAGYDAVISLVDDVEYSPCALQVLLSAYTIALGSYEPSRITMDVFNRTSSSRETKQKELGTIIPGTDQVAYIMHKEVWSIVEPYLREYISRFIQPFRESPRPYRNRNHDEIKLWFAELVGGLSPHYEYVTGPAFSASQDACVEVAMLKHSITRLTTKVNHVRHIGLYGEHMFPELHKNMGFDSTRLDTFSTAVAINALTDVEVLI